MSFLSQLASAETLRRAWERVAAKRGVGGIDRVSVDDFGADLDANLRRLAEEIASGRYRPLPVLRLRLPFLAAGDRALVVPAVRDRVVQRAISDLLAPAVDPALSPACRAFRKGGSAVAAADDVSRWIEAGSPWVLRADVASFFDSIDPVLLRDKLTPFVDADGLRFLDRVLRCRVFDHEQVTEMIDGIPQGSPLSPLLGNLYLADLDAAVRAGHPRYLRYCDDLIVLELEESAVRAAQEEIAAQLAAVRLKLNDTKTRVCRAEDGFVFLGYHFGAAGRGPATKAVEALRFRLAELAAAEPFEVASLDALYRGWSNYFGDHPECWTDMPAGLLAVLRKRFAESGEQSDGEIERLVAERWKQVEDPPPGLALALARAWSDAGREEQTWLEWAASCAGSRSGTAAHQPWSELLGTPAEDLAAVARKLTGPPGERVARLVEALTEGGRFEIARRLASATTAYAAVPEPAAHPAEDLAAIADFRLLESFFEGREGVHAVAAASRSGQRRFTPVERPIEAADWRAHLRGEATLALPLIRAGDTAALGVLDVDIERRALEQRLGVPDELLGRALGAALRLRSELERRGCRCLLELSGYKGYHLWLRLDEPAPCFALRRWLLAVVGSAGPSPEGIRVEVFPDRDRARRDSINPVVKLPLGVHAKTGKRCALLDERGEPLSDPFEAIRSLPRLSARVVREAAEEPEPTADSAGTPDGATATAAIGARARRMLDGCHVLGYLERRAAQTSYLNHRERSSLLCTLGHLGEEGTAALHAIIGHTYNYRPEITDRHIARLPSHPMSCPKLRELHPEAVAFGACSCKFTIRGRGYPTPLLFALKPGEIAVFRRPEPAAARSGSEPGKQGPKPAAGTAATAAQAPNLRQRAEETVRKLGELHRHRRGIEASIGRLHAELAAILDAASADALDLSSGRLVRRRRTEGEGWDFLIEV